MIENPLHFNKELTLSILRARIYLYQHYLNGKLSIRDGKSNDRIETTHDSSVRVDKSKTAYTTLLVGHPY
jgi:hypothetical protein